MDYSDLINKTTEDLKKSKNELLKDLFLKKIKNSVGQIENPLEIRIIRRNVARISTALSEKNNKIGDLDVRN